MWPGLYVFGDLISLALLDSFPVRGEAVRCAKSLSYAAMGAYRSVLTTLSM